jgi:dTDP-4-amino-4,6-dideoxygalactose transaminase
MTIRQTDPLASYLEHKGEIDAAVQEVLGGGWYINGQQVAAFEREFAAFIGSTHAVGVASGTDALHLALRALGIGPGHQVITTSHTAVATVAAIELAGAEPVLVDIEAASYTMALAPLAEAVATLAPGGALKAVVAVHLYGHPADAPAIRDLTRRHDLKLIEDCAQAHGARIGGAMTGTFGDVAAFSFYPTKNLGAFGDGGAVTTSDEETAQRLRWLREYGWKERYISHLVGLNSRLDELHAAMLRVKLRHLAADNERRRALARVYDAQLPADVVSVPTVKAGCEHSYHQYVVRSSRRDALRDHLQREGIATAIHYPQPVHSQPAYRGRLRQIGSLQATEQACNEIVSLPMYPQLPVADVERVCAAVAKAR